MSLPRDSVRGISFDYGHVLGGLDLDELARRIGALGALGADADVVKLKDSMGEAYREHDAAIARGEGHEAGWRALMGHLVGAGSGVTDHVRLARIVDALWAAQPQSNLWRYVPEEARALLKELAERKVPMVITSNSEGRVAELLSEVGIADFFLAILDSGRLGFGKPDPRIFALAAEKLSLPIDRVVHVGDSEKADIVGAKNAGAWAVRFDAFLPFAGPESCADAVTTSYERLRSVLLEGLGLAP